MSADVKKKVKRFQAIEGDREKLERQVIQVLLNPNATREEVDAAIRRLNPVGSLKLVNVDDNDVKD